MKRLLFFFIIICIFSISAFATEQRDYVFSEDFEKYSYGDAIVYGGAGPTNTYQKLKGVTSGWAEEYASMFDIVSGVGIRDIKIRNNPTDNTTKALQVDAWYVVEPVGVRIADCTNESTAVVGKDAATVADMTFTEKGEYTVALKLYVPGVISSQGLRAGYTNGVKGKDVVLRATLSNGQTVTSSISITDLNVNTWHNMSISFNVTDSVYLLNLDVYSGVSIVSGNDQRYGEFYIDDWQMYRAAKTATVYLDTNKTVPASISPVTFGKGTQITLPSKQDIDPYFSSNDIDIGFMIGNRPYLPGSVYTFSGNEADNLEIYPLADALLVPQGAELIFYDDLEAHTSKTDIVYGGASPKGTYITVDGVEKEYDYLDGKFNYLAGEGICNIYTRVDGTGSNHAIYIDGWYATPNNGIIIGDINEKNAVEGNGVVTRKSLDLGEYGNYVFSSRVLIPENLTYMAGTTNGLPNGAAGNDVIVRLVYTDSTYEDIRTAVSVENLDKWVDVSVPFTLNGEKNLDHISIFVYFNQYNGTESRYGEYFIDNVKLYKTAKKAEIYLDNYLTVKSENSPFSFVDGSKITLPSASEVSEYVADTYALLGFKVGDGTTVYPAGSEYTFTSSDLDGVKICPVFEVVKNHPVYGKLVVDEDFEGYADNTVIDTGSWSTTKRPIMKLDSSFEQYADHFYLTSRDCTIKLYIKKDFSGSNMAIAAGRGSNASMISFGTAHKDTAQMNFNVPGKYVVTLDVYIPSKITDSAYGVVGADNPIIGSSMLLRAEYFDGSVNDMNIDSFDITANDLDKWKTLKVEFNLTENSLFDMVRSLCFDTEDIMYYVDNLRFYSISDKVIYRFPNGEEYYEFFLPGDTVTIPDRREFLDKIPEGMLFSHFELDGNKYVGGDTYTTSSDVNTVVFDAVCEELTYTYEFSLGNINGTVADISVVKGQSIVLPDVDNDNFIGWKVPGVTSIMPVGSTLEFPENFLSKADSDAQMKISAVWNNEPSATMPTVHYALTDDMFVGATGSVRDDLAVAYGTSLYPKSSVFDAAAGVSAIDVVKAAVNLYNACYDEVDTYTDEQVVEFAKQRGIISNDFDTTLSAVTWEQAIKVFANAMPDNFYYDMTDSGLADSDSTNMYIEKLVRAGIVDNDIVPGNEMSNLGYVNMLARLASVAERTVENKLTIWVIGDSLTDQNRFQSYIKSLDDVYFDDNVNFVNYGVGGYDTSHFIAPDYEPYADIMNRAKPGDFLFIALGTNDATLWLWYDNPSIGTSYLSYEDSLNNYYLHAKNARAVGMVPVYICPVGYNINVIAKDSLEYTYNATKIIQCMNEANTRYNMHTPIINFKTVTDNLFNNVLTAEQRDEIYAPGDAVHYSSYGARYVAGIFCDIVMADSNPELEALRTHLIKNYDDKSAKTSTSVTKTESAVEISVSLSNIEAGSTVWVAGYSNGKLKDAKSIIVTTNTVETTQLNKYIDCVKVLVFDKSNALEPIAKAEVIPVK